MALLDCCGRSTTLCVSPDDAFYAGRYDGKLALFSVEDPTQRRMLHLPMEGSWVTAFSPDGRWVAAGGEGRVVVLEATTGAPVSGFDVSGSVWGLQFSSRSARLLVSAEHVTLWDWRERSEIVRFLSWVPFVYHAALSPSADRIAMPTSRGTVEVWDVASRTTLFELTGHGSNVFSVVFSLDGRRLATGGLDKSARVWDASTGTEILRIATPWQANRVAFLPDGRHLAVGSTGLAIHRLSDGRQVAGFATGLCYGLSVGGGGGTIVVQGPGGPAHILRLR